MGISDLFKVRQAVSQAQETILRAQTDDRRLEKETYVAYGNRICGKVTASLAAFAAYLPKVYHEEKQAQINDVELQDEEKKKIQLQINSLNGQIEKKNVAAAALKEKIASTKEKISDFKQNLIAAKEKNGEVNKMAKMKLILGTVILSILTLYLFIFYSSSFYSAFFKTFDYDVTVGAAMFDPRAIPNSLASGFGQLLFILCAPIIFMGLGYGLHFFAMQKNWTKYVKMGCVLLITFVFDCIIAYLIAQKIYDVQVLTKLGEYPDFDLDMAMHDVNVWAVIFCGFIVYLIWGIVFDMTMTAYEDLRSNRHEILKYEALINGENNNLDQLQTLLNQNKDDITNPQVQVADLNIALNRKVHYNFTIIRLAMSDFHSGWMTMMNALNCIKKDQEQANEIFNNIINELFKEKV